MTLRDEPLLILDGACGTNLQRLGLPPEAWNGYDGCNEALNLFLPSAMETVHRSFLDAGARVLETNTFGANPIVLAEYGLQDRTEEINHAAVATARRAIAGAGVRGWVAGSVGPGTRLVSLGHVTREVLAASTERQIVALAEAGVDLLLLETCQDLLQVKTAVVTAFSVLERLGLDIPVAVSVTIETTGTMLVGSDIAAVAATLEPYPLLYLGLNCATGPEGMASHVRWLSRSWPGRVSCVPNAGIPQVAGGRAVYPLGPDDFARQLRAFVARDGVSVVGGCCGTSPDHIRALVRALDGVAPAPRDPDVRPSLASLYQAAEIRQEIPPFLIGERANANGSRAFRDCLLEGDYEGALRVGVEQEAGGAHALDLCTAYAGRDEAKDLPEMVTRMAGAARAPLVVDSTSADCIEEALRRYPGRCLVNSIHLEDGGKNLDRVCRLAKQYGAAVVALTISESGMAMTVEDKVAVARRLHDLAVGTYGLRPQDLFIDVLTFTIGSGDPTLRDAAAHTLRAIRAVKEALPGVHTLLGVSNVSFGLPPLARRVLNSVFLAEAVAAGLDAAIIDAAKVLPLAAIKPENRQLCLDLVWDRPGPDGGSVLPTLLERFNRKGTGEPAAPTKDTGTPEENLTRKVMSGDKEGLEDLLHVLLARRPAAAIIDQVLVAAMRRVGELFGRGEMLLPFVLQSAEVTRRAVDLLQPYLARAGTRPASKRMLLATVAGDVHDIGKNLVDILLSNNGYEVVNLGIKVPAEVILREARAREVDVIGLSGLLVKSALIMKENLAFFQEAGLSVPVLLGGAALTRRFVAEECVPRYEAPVVYCADAFAGLSAMEALEKGTLTATTPPERAAAAAKPGPRERGISRDVPVPTPPFLGLRHVTDLDPRVLFPYVNEQALFRGRWGFRRGKLSAAEYDTLVRETVLPRYRALQDRAVRDGLVAPRIAYGWFRCFSEGDTLVVEDGPQRHRFPFPRQASDPGLCIADFFRSEAEGGDVAGFFVVTIGPRLAEETARLFAENAYQDYHALHAFGVEVTDALAEYWHETMRVELGIGERRPNAALEYAAQGYQGSRYGFGYPACPDLEAHRPVFALLRPEAIGVTLTESLEMVPEVSTSALVAHHPQARYFAV